MKTKTRTELLHEAAAWIQLWLWAQSLESHLRKNTSFLSRRFNLDRLDKITRNAGIQLGVDDAYNGPGCEELKRLLLNEFGDCVRISSRDRLGNVAGIYWELVGVGAGKFQPTPERLQQMQRSVGELREKAEAHLISKGLGAILTGAMG